jgi:chromosome segregation ATPase
LFERLEKENEQISVKHATLKNLTNIKESGTNLLEDLENKIKARDAEVYDLRFKHEKEMASMGTQVTNLEQILTMKILNVKSLEDRNNQLNDNNRQLEILNKMDAADGETEHNQQTKNLRASITNLQDDLRNLKDQNRLLDEKLKKEKTVAKTLESEKNKLEVKMTQIDAENKFREQNVYAEEKRLKEENEKLLMQLHEMQDIRLARGGGQG